MKSNFFCQAGDVVLPLISVILPVYNGEKYLESALNSVLAQSHTNFELIIIDDGSTDSSLSILKKYKNLDKRIRLLSRENRNLVTTLNESIDLARGEWIARMDQDDIALDHRFESQLSWLNLTGADICGSWVKVFGGDDTRVIRFTESHFAIGLDLLFKNPLAHPAVMMRTHLARKLKYDKSFEGAEDYDFWVRAYLCGAKLTNIPRVLLRYRQHPAQISSTSRIEQAFVSDSIRRKYWNQLIVANDINDYGANSALEAICVNSNARLNFYEIDQFFKNLLSKHSNQEHLAIVLNIQSIYFKHCNKNYNLFWDIWGYAFKIGICSTLSIFLKMILLKVLFASDASDALSKLKNLHNRLFGKSDRFF